MPCSSETTSQNLAPLVGISRTFAQKAVDERRKRLRAVPEETGKHTDLVAALQQDTTGDQRAPDGTMQTRLTWPV